MEEDEKRIAKILGVKSRDLPDVSEETLKNYYSYLSKNLSFPFYAEYSKETGPLENTRYDIKVTGLLGIENLDIEFYGLFCKGKEGKRKIEIPLAEVKVKQKSRNKQLIEDYKTWFWNHR